MQPTGNDVQLVEPVLTNMLLGYMQDDMRFIAPRVFPYVTVAKDSGTYGIFTKKYWFSDKMEPRAYGGDYPRTGFGVESSTYATLQYALAVPIADETRANSTLPMDLESAAARYLAQQSLIRKERAFSADFMKTSVWGTDDTSAADWSNFSTSDPVANVETAKRTISANTGFAANTMVMGEIVRSSLINHPDLLDRVKYTAAATQAAIEQAIAAIFGVQNFWVSMASYNSANEGQDASMSAIIDDDCLICHVSPNPGIFTASAGYTFTWAPGGGAGSIYNVRDNFNDADIIKAKEQWDQKVVAADLGYFYSDIV